MSRIFISYRRADTSGYVIAIYDRLAKKYDPAYIFRDLDTIDYGDDFVERIEQAVQSCDVLLAIIGRSWASVTDSNGRRRLDNPHDFVRLEVATALRRGIRVIPLLVGGASMPYADELPDDLKSLSRRNALEVSDRDFHPHMDRLIRAIDWALEAAKQSSSATAGIRGELTVKVIPGTPQTATPPKITLPNVLAILPPPFEWCEIPAGKVTLEDASDRDGTKGGVYDVSTFAIAKYPVTNAQYQVFAHARSGYIDPRWWNYSEFAKQWRYENPNPEATAYSGDDLPRTRMSWYDSLAFCRWLTAQMNERERWDNAVSRPYAITLPTEQQWQRAGQGDDGRKYPWGNDFDPSRCNTWESNIRQPTSVMKYPNGASPYTVMDLIGNVWEWCLTQWDNNSIKVINGNPRVARGGSSLVYGDSSYVVSRLDNLPSSRGIAQGFRMVVIHIS